MHTINIGLNFLNVSDDFVEHLRGLVFENADFILEALQLVWLTSIFCGEGSNDILDLFGVLQSKVLHVPVVNNKGQLITILDLLGNQSPYGESLTHDSDEHVQQVNDDEKRAENEQHVEIYRFLAFGIPK